MSDESSDISAVRDQYLLEFPPDFRVFGGAGELCDGGEEIALFALDGGEESVLRSDGGIFFRQEFMPLAIAKIELRDVKEKDRLLVDDSLHGQTREKVVAVEEGVECPAIVVVEWIGKKNTSDDLLRAAILIARTSELFCKVAALEVFGAAREETDDVVILRRGATVERPILEFE